MSSLLIRIVTRNINHAWLNCNHLNVSCASRQHFLSKCYHAQVPKLFPTTICRKSLHTTDLLSAKSTDLQECNPEFGDTFSEVVKYLTESHPDITESNKWLAKGIVQSISNGEEFYIHTAQFLSMALDYNVPPRFLQPGLLLVNVFNALRMNADEDERHLACIMGCCVDMWAASLLIYHDTMDQNMTRDGQECWYRHNNLGIGLAINDAILIKSGAHVVLAEYFKNEPYYEAITHLLLNAAQNVNIGKQLDLRATNTGGQPLFSLFTRQYYDVLSSHKAGYGYFYVPFTAAMLMAGITDQEVLARVESILVKVGMFHQIQKDFDCFGESAGPSGDGHCDIAEGKCTWLAVSALERVDETQKSLFENCYGYKDAEKVCAVKNLYKDLQLPALFFKVKAATEDAIYGHIENISHVVSPETFSHIRSAYIPCGSLLNKW